MVATSTTLFLYALYVLTMLSFPHNYCCEGPKSLQKQQIEMKLYHFFITPVKAEMCVHCLGARAHVRGGFSKASVGGLPAPQQSFHATDLPWPHSCVTCNSQMGMCDVI